MPPERFDHYMARANAAYYARRDPFQDFATAPELTQVFGELLGGWARIVWRMMGEPAPVMLVEAGPGSGRLMADALRAFGPDAAVHFIETSPRLREAQRARVPAAIWHEALAQVPAGAMILLANEFLDALPVRQFVRRDTGWCERHVENGAYLELPVTVDLPDDPPGSVREVNEAARAFVASVAARDAVALFIDYGPAQAGAGDSVQAIRDGAAADPLAAAGEADITAHVDFSALAKAARQGGAAAQGPVKQNAFLTALGLHQRTDQLALLHPEQAAALRMAARRLTAPEAMGSLFKAFAVCPPGLPTLPGFES